ncbi:acyltransferase [Williamsia sp.]|uniref:acyltransferase family protein n=1 Tax=Williamsia sp. TaxID=1872085 RepID=UPI001A2DEAE0|nr:acyltransferase [Williamsia sp.]MBJ7289148.1 acyltransferase [Williamsia sp.]
MAHRAPDAGLPAPAVSGSVTPGIKPGRIRGLDGPRGFAAMAILTIHVTGHYSPDTAASGKIQFLGQALILFFALSGFLLFLPMVRALFRGDSSQPHVRDYVIHRALRIFPGYLVIFLIANFVLQAVYLRNAQTSLVSGSTAGTGMMTEPGALLANLTLVQTYLPGLIQTGINPAWSLTLEVAFYIALPIIGVAMFALRRRTGVRPLTLAFGMTGAVLLLGVVGKGVGAWLAVREGVSDIGEQNFGPYWCAVVLRSFLGGADAFAFGMAAAVVFAAVSAGLIGSTTARRIRVFSIAALLPALFAMLVLIALGSNYQATLMSLASGLFIVIVVLPIAEGRRSVPAEILDWRPFAFLGRISFSVYLWHFPLLLALGKWGLMAGDTWPGLVRNLVLLSIVTVAVSAVTYRFVERPAISFARKIKTH